MSACFQIQKGIFVSSTDVMDLCQVLNNVDECKKTDSIKRLESYIKGYCNPKTEDKKQNETI